MNNVSRAIFKQIRTDNRLTGADFGKMLGISKQQISMIENGERKISADIIDKLYELFSIEPIIWFSDVYTPLNYKKNVASFPIENKGNNNFLDKEKFSKLMRLQNEALDKIEAAEEKLNVYLSDKDRARIMQQIVISSFNNDDKEVNYNNVVHLVKFAG